jgi:uncharacterized protein
MTDSQPPLPAPTAEVRQWAMLCHFSAFFGLVFPFGNLLGPFILWQIKKEMDPFVDAQGKEALNFQITVAIASMVCVVLMVVVIGFPLLILVGIAAVVFTIIAGAKANDGFAYRYPYTWRVIK